jgi:nucleoside-diphosphate-sugar epimerase
MPQTVLVTGGTGYIASWCIAELLNRGYTVRATVRSLAKEPAVRAAASLTTDPGTRLECVVADLTDDAGWAEAMQGVDYVLHVAQSLGLDTANASPRHAEDLVTPAHDGALRVLAAASHAGVKRVVVTSAANAASPSSYTEDGVTDETLWTDPNDLTLIPYRRAKTVGEKTAWDFMSTYTGPMTLTTILPGAVFGPIRSTSTVGSVSIIARMLTGKMSGTPRIGFEIVDVRDLADIHIRAMTHPDAAGQRFLATGEFMWMNDMATALRSSLGSAAAKVSTRQLPDILVRFMARYVDKSLQAITPALGRRARHSTAKAEDILGWTPRPAAETVADCGDSLVTWKVV